MKTLHTACLDPESSDPILDHELRRDRRRRRRLFGHRRHTHSTMRNWPRCPGCRQPIHPHAAACPACGTPAT